MTALTVIGLWLLGSLSMFAYCLWSVDERTEDSLGFASMMAVLWIPIFPYFMVDELIKKLKKR